MKPKWQVRRSTAERLDGQRRWDCAYRCLLRWASEAASQASEDSPPSTQQEDKSDESRHLCSRVDTTTTKGSNH